MRLNYLKTFLLLCNISVSFCTCFLHFGLLHSYLKARDMERSNESDNIVIRDTQEVDLESINAIYNEAVINTIASFDTEEKTIEFRKSWFNSRSRDKHIVIVCEVNKEVVGWASLNQWSDRAAYNGTVENSIYIYAKHHGKGYGKLLMKELVERGRQIGLHTILSRIADGNAISIRLHEKFGFQMVGVTKEVGYKFNRFIDVVMMQLML